MLWLLTTFILATSANGERLPGFEQDPGDSPQLNVDNLEFGDLKLTDKQLYFINHGKDVGVSDNSYAATNKPNSRWKNAIIPYVIDCSLVNMPVLLESIRLAQEEWMNKTCIKFVKRTTERDYLRFFRGTGCWAFVGRIGGMSRISVGYRCGYQHVMAHEIGHVVGFYHEQNRMDRDDWVEIMWNNIRGSSKRNFRLIVNTDSLGVPYDYASIMHYPWYAFSINRNDTMRPKQPVPIQPYQHVSASDIKQTSLMYNCPAILKEREQARNTQLGFSAVGANTGNVSVCKNTGKYSDLDCDIWTKRGDCTRNGFIWQNCKRSCNLPICDPKFPCKDNDVRCTYWAELGNCKRAYAKHCVLSCADRCADVRPSPTPPPPTTQRPTRLPTVAPEKRVTLGFGKLCFDKDDECGKWAARGHCKISFYVLRNCRLSCNVTDCDVGIQKPSGSCAEPLGLAWDGKSFTLPDSAFSASSYLYFPRSGWSAHAMNARLYFEDDYDNFRIGSWCVKTYKDLKGSYVGVDLQQQKTVQYIATQGRDKYSERVGRYNIGYSNNGTDFTVYQENGKDKVFDGNCDHFTPILNRFNNPIHARYLRLYPLEANYPCVRMEFYGC